MSDHLVHSNASARSFKMRLRTSSAKNRKPFAVAIIGGFPVIAIGRTGRPAVARNLLKKMTFDPSHHKDRVEERTSGGKNAIKFKKATTITSGVVHFDSGKLIVEARPDRGENQKPEKPNLARVRRAREYFSYYKPKEWNHVELRRMRATDKGDLLTEEQLKIIEAGYEDNDDGAGDEGDSMAELTDRWESQPAEDGYDSDDAADVDDLGDRLVSLALSSDVSKPVEAIKKSLEALLRNYATAKLNLRVPSIPMSSSRELSHISQQAFDKQSSVDGAVERLRGMMRGHLDKESSLDAKARYIVDGLVNKEYQKVCSIAWMRCCFRVEQAAAKLKQETDEECLAAGYKTAEMAGHNWNRLFDWVSSVIDMDLADPQAISALRGLLNDTPGEILTAETKYGISDLGAQIDKLALHHSMAA